MSKKKQPAIVAKPWQIKYYAIGTGFKLTDPKYLKLPNQARQILKWMYDNDIRVSKKKNMSGPAICTKAIEDKYVTTRIEPAVLFAYYARKMEEVGMVLADTGRPQTKDPSAVKKIESKQ